MNFSSIPTSPSFLIGLSESRSFIRVESLLNMRLPEWELLFFTLESFSGRADKKEGLSIEIR